MSPASLPLVGSDRSRGLRHAHPSLRAVVLTGTAPPHDVGGGAAAGGGDALAAGYSDHATGSAAESLKQLRVPVTTVGGLAALAELAYHFDGPLLVVAPDLFLSPTALLDVVDSPSATTATLTLDPVMVKAGVSQAVFAPVRASRSRRVESSATGFHTVGRPTDLAVGLVRVATPDLDEAAHLWRAAAAEFASVDSDLAVDDSALTDLALLVLVRGGLSVGANGLGLYTVGRGGLTVEGAPGSMWEQRLRNSSRGNDGAFSRAVIRPLSRRVTTVGLARDWKPNIVTAVSLALGLFAASLVLLDSWSAWAGAALLLQASLVVDCVDGEIARFTRSYSPLGAWLDGVSDRIKELAVIATVTVVGVRHSQDLWGLSVVLLVVLTVRQVEDQAYNARLRAGAGRPDTVRPLGEPGDGTDLSAPTSVPAPASGRALLVQTTKQVLHVPIAERYLLISLGLLTHSAVVLLVVLLAAVLVALAWTHVGRSLRAWRRADAFRADRPDPEVALLLDLGPLVRAAAAVLPMRGRPSLAWFGLLVVCAGALLMLAVAPAWAAAGCVVFGALMLGAGCIGGKSLASSRFGWQLPGWIAAAEAATVLGAVAALPEGQRWAAFAWFGAVAWHLYDMTYRARETGVGPAGWVSTVTLGSDGRMVLVVAWWAFGLPVTPLLSIGAVVLFAVWAGESGYSWRSLAPGRSRAGATDSGRTRG